MRQLVVGLTGGIACGKSTVAAQLRQLGALHIDVDAIARAVVAPGEPALAAVVEAFGDRVIADDGALDRPALGALVFADRGLRRRLEAIVHPAMTAQVAAQLQLFRAAATQPVAVIDAAILFEMGLHRLCDETLAITAPPALQLARLMDSRRLSRAEAELRLAAQAEPQWRGQTTVSIDNAGTPGELAAQVAAWWQQLHLRHALGRP